jgi:hypothetical protein
MSGRDVYRFGYRWRIEGPIETVFHYASDARTFCEWFPVFKDVRADEPVGPVHVGSHCVARVKALLPYELDWDITVARYEPPELIETAVQLSLNGRFRMHGWVRYRCGYLPGQAVLVINEQELAAERALPRWAHGLAQSAFRLNHDWAMAQGEGPLQAIVRYQPAVATA